MPTCLTRKTDNFVQSKQSIVKSGCARHCYQFEGNLNDSCGNANGTANSGVDPGFITYGATDGVANLGMPLCVNKLVTSSLGSNSPPFQPWGAGSAYEYVVDLGEGVNVNPECFSISVWFHPQFTKDDRLFSKATSPSGSDHVFAGQIVNESGHTNALRFRLTTEGSTFSEVTSGDSVFSLSAWNHAVFWYDGCEMRIYVNGSQVASSESDLSSGSAPNGNVAQTNAKTAIGSQPPGAGSSPTSDGMRVFAGCLDQVVFWNCALSEDVMNELYNSGDGTDEISSLNTASVYFKKPAALKRFSFKVPVRVEDLSSELKCASITVQVCDKKTGKVVRTLVNQVSDLSKWPGIIENLGQSQEEDECRPTFNARFNLCFCHCPVKMCGRRLKVVVKDCADVFDLDEAEVVAEGHQVKCCHRKH